MTKFNARSRKKQHLNLTKCEKHPVHQNSVQLKFTEKVYPHLAAREHHLKEQPFPKIRQASGKDEQTGDVIRLI